MRYLASICGCPHAIKNLKRRKNSHFSFNNIRYAEIISTQEIARSLIALLTDLIEKINYFEQKLDFSWQCRQREQQEQLHLEPDLQYAVDPIVNKHAMDFPNWAVEIIGLIFSIGGGNSGRKFSDFFCLKRQICFDRKCCKTKNK